MVTPREMMTLAQKESARLLGCCWEDLAGGTDLVLPRKNASGKRGSAAPFCFLVSYGSCTVAAADTGAVEALQTYFKRFPRQADRMETPALYALNKLLEPLGQGICFQSEYFLPLRLSQTEDCPWKTVVLTTEQLASLDSASWPNALTAHHRHLDRIGVAALDGCEMVGLAACSEDSPLLWQIGIDVLPSGRRKGIAVSLVKQLAREVLARGKVPFYGAAWCNIPSVRCAVSAGFVPVWNEVMTAPLEEIRRMMEGERVLF